MQQIKNIKQVNNTRKTENSPLSEIIILGMGLLLCAVIIHNMCILCVSSRQNVECVLTLALTSHSLAGNVERLFCLFSNSGPQKYGKIHLIIFYYFLLLLSPEP